jgi:hypothetical protein
MNNFNIKNNELDTNYNIFLTKLILFCILKAGFTGSLCETLNACYSNPCLNAGTCLNTASGFVCSCTDQWTGKNCETSKF